ncbi:alpha-L RNA-binding motif-containing protein [Wolfiporia cocos MD-104 SS10]|uniref:Alpha-L RNA-binding motif-containing protein n=1 Tax=Wolfiporia cocos (strain MD-104) TaxID=742152 RepID=A0A2H3JIJ3_WOLCO|nr:alpha-L RNA-binding motif-containing protein [Wolfiporia cocos MD-104 SS10]
MRDANVYSIRRAMPRMSWHPQNLYNLWRRSLGGKRLETDFTSSTKSLFQQRWASKALLRAYHGDFINEKIFKRWYLPETLPDVRSQASRIANAASMNKWARRDQTADREAKRLENEAAKGLAPVGSLMFREVERRIDVIVFRSCFAHSVYEARRLVIHGDVLLNGKKHTNPNTRLAPGDMITVDPKAIRFLRPSAAPKPDSEAAATDSTSIEEEASTDTENPEANHSESVEQAAPSSSEADMAKHAVLPAKSKNWKRADPKKNLTPFSLPPYASPSIFIPAYIEPSFATCSAIYVRHPTARPGYSEIPTPYDADGEVIRAAWEWYTRVRPRMRSKSQLARMPENRQ